ncbi:MAG: LiaF domain-containing protein [Bacteroidota bacterium]
MSDKKKFGNSFWVGIIIISIGGFILLDRMEVVFFPHWLFSWKTFLIALGVITGINKQFKGIGWLVLIIVGTFFLLDEIPGLDLDLRHYAFPIIVIAIGIVIVFRSAIFPSSGNWRNFWSGDDYGKKENSALISSQDGTDDYMDLTSVFGGTKRRIFSKTFKGGQITNIFGGTELDLSQADIEGAVVIDTVTLFGGIKILVPGNWEVKSNITAILGGVEDKRMTSSSLATNKKLVLTGTCSFGGVEIKSF